MRLPELRIQDVVCTQVRLLNAFKAAQSLVEDGAAKLPNMLVQQAAAMSV